jgi:hypothetical protein
VERETLRNVSKHQIIINLSERSGSGWEPQQDETTNKITTHINPWNYLESPWEKATGLNLTEHARKGLAIVSLEVCDLLTGSNIKNYENLPKHPEIETAKKVAKRSFPCIFYPSFETLGN